MYIAKSNQKQAKKQPKSAKISQIQPKSAKSS
jgi:hypothetical protein